jgi:hypothetical protein
LDQILNNKSDTKHKDIAKFLFEQEYLLLNKCINNNTMKKNAINGFKRIFYGDKYSPIDRKHTDLHYHNAQVIIQAVGRICRCKNKNKNIYIYADKEVVERLACVKSDLDKRILNKEFLKLLNQEKKKSYDVKLFSEQNTSIAKEFFNKQKYLRSSKEKVDE